MADSKDAAKQLIPFLQRADELQKHDRRIAYFCASVADVRVSLSVR
jgi:hypothetical protein